MLLGFISGRNFLCYFWGVTTLGGGGLLSWVGCYFGGGRYFWGVVTFGTFSEQLAANFKTLA